MFSMDKYMMPWWQIMALFMDKDEHVALLHFASLNVNLFAPNVNNTTNSWW